MNTKHICKFCKRSFPCGRSLGGHIRSHLIHKNNSPSEEPDSSKPRYELRENPKKTYKDSNLLSSSSPSSWSTESENEIRVRNSKGKSCFISQSSVFEPEEEDISGAMCLIMLSRDKMSTINTQFLRSSSCGYFQNGSKLKEYEVFRNGYDQNKRYGSKIKEFEDGYTTNDQRNKYHESGLDEIESGFEIYKSNSKRSKFECTTCNKVFHSYQALGGHRASHKKMLGVKFYPKPESNDEDYPSPNYEYHQDQESQTKIGNGSSSTSTLPKKVVQKHECPICFRVFSSGQALGGHKRSHVLAANNSNNNYEISMVNNSSNSEITGFLNLNISPIPRPRPRPHPGSGPGPSPEIDDTGISTGISTGIDTDPAEEGANTLVGLIKPYWWVEAHTIMSHF